MRSHTLPAWRHAIISLAAISWLAGCNPDSASLTGLRCEDGQCVSGFTCDTLDDVCVETGDSCEEAGRAILCAAGETARRCAAGEWTECLLSTCPDADGDGVGDGTGAAGNTGCDTPEVDLDDSDPSVCTDSERLLNGVIGDGCEDCGIAATWNPANDGTDTDGDTVCDLGDVCNGHDDLADMDYDGVADGCDSCPGDEMVGTGCGDCGSCDGAGACVGDCDDGVFCNGEESCDPAGGCLPGTPPCSGVECNGCDEAADTCFDPLGTACTDDGSFCNGPEQCDGSGACVSVGDPCPGTDCGLCDESAGDCFTPAGTSCTDDGLFCSGIEECDGLGACVGTGDPCLAGLECDQTCNEDSDDCFDPATTACGDSSATDCTGPDTCDGAGACLDNHQIDGGACDDCPTSAPVCLTCSAGLCPDDPGCTPSVIAFDAASFNNENGTSQLAWSHTTTSAADGERIMLVGVGIKYEGGDEDAVTVTYGGVDLTFLDSATSGQGAEESRIEVWYLLDPASGTDDVVVNLGASTRTAAGSMTFTGVDQAAPEAVFTDSLALAASGEPTGTVTTITDNAWVVDMLTWRRDRAATVGTALPQTERYQVTQHWAVAGSTFGPVTPPGAVTMDWTLDMDPSWALGIVSLAPGCF